MAKPARNTEQLEALIGKVGAAVDQSEGLIEGLLTFARSDRGLDRNEIVDLPTAVMDAVDLAASAAAAGNITIGTALEPAAAVGDRVMVERLVANLLDNTVRHNVPAGWVRVTTGGDADRVFLTVANSGPVVPADKVPELFEPFRRLTKRVGDGVGLGLSIVRSVVTAHDGDLAARPLPEGGLEIRVTLRRAPSRSTRAQPPRHSSTISG
jgi:signal transduction histidine kinase